jgi:hypothetical protein
MTPRSHTSRDANNDSDSIHGIDLRGTSSIYGTQLNNNNSNSDSLYSTRAASKQGDHSRPGSAPGSRPLTPRNTGGPALSPRNPGPALSAPNQPRPESSPPVRSRESSIDLNSGFQDVELSEGRALQPGITSIYHSRGNLSPRMRNVRAPRSPRGMCMPAPKNRTPPRTSSPGKGYKEVII